MGLDGGSRWTRRCEWWSGPEDRASCAMIMDSFQSVDLVFLIHCDLTPKVVASMHLIIWLNDDNFHSLASAGWAELTYRCN